MFSMCIDAPESTANSRSSGLFEVGAGIDLASFNRSLQRRFVRILELFFFFFAKFHATLRAHLSWWKVSSCDLPRILARKDYAHEAHTFG